MGVVELPTGSKRVGLSGLTHAGRSASHASPKRVDGLARTVVVLEGRVLASTKASYVEISESSAC